MYTLIIDSNYVCYRAFYASGDLIHKGVPTGITYGFFNQVFNLVKKIRPDNLIFFWDSKHNVRKEIYPEYKAKRRSNREKTEEEIEMWKSAFKQFSIIRRSILPEVGLHQSFMQSGYESDDLIAKYTMNISDNESVLIMSSDEDLYQLLTDRVGMFNNKYEDIYLEMDFKNEKGITPQQWVDVKAIAGCNSDNVKGVPTIGEKRAIQFIKKEMPESSPFYQKIINNRDLIERNYKLVRLPFEGTIDIREQNIQNEFSMKQFLRICRKYGFQSFRKEDKREEIKKLMSNI